jgi:hypothetical protein
LICCHIGYVSVLLNMFSPRIASLNESILQLDSLVKAEATQAIATRQAPPK